MPEAIILGLLKGAQQLFIERAALRFSYQRGSRGWRAWPE
jgi:hypothetical protein